MNENVQKGQSGADILDTPEQHPHRQHPRGPISLQACLELRASLQQLRSMENHQPHRLRWFPGLWLKRRALGLALCSLQAEGIASTVMIQIGVTKFPTEKPTKLDAVVLVLVREWNR